MSDDGVNPVIPPWLANPELAAPCPCGEPMGSEFWLVKGETGLVRLFHPDCIEADEDDDG
jgi:hypothetical protein